MTSFLFFKLLNCFNAQNSIFSIIKTEEKWNFVSKNFKYFQVEHIEYSLYIDINFIRYSWADFFTFPKNFNFAIYLFTSGDVGKLRHFRFLCDDDELPIAHYTLFILWIFYVQVLFSLILSRKNLFQSKYVTCSSNQNCLHF